MKQPSEEKIWYSLDMRQPHIPSALLDAPSNEDAISGGTSAPFDVGAYPQVWQKPGWSVDLRHIYWLYDVLASGGVETALEIGCLHGATSMAFVEALNAGALRRATFCDVKVLPSLRKTLSRSIAPSRMRIFEGISVDLLDEGGAFDLVFIDGDHSLETVSAELERILKLPPRCIVAHDTTAAAAGFSNCEGPAYLKHQLQVLGWLCLEDAMPRSGELTHRGMFFATTDPALYEIARASLVARCGVLAVQVSRHITAPPSEPTVLGAALSPSVSQSSPPSRTTSWRQLLQNFCHVIRCKVRKGWLW